MYCRALNITPTVPLFRVFYKLCKQGNWFSFQSRVGKGLKPCIRGAPTSLKKWKDKFFLIDRRAAPIAMSWRHHDSSVADVLPGPSEYNAADVATLLEVPIQLHKPYNSLLYIAGLSPTWKGLGSVPIMKGPGGEVLLILNSFAFPDLVLDIPPKTPAMEKAEVACQKVIAARERKKQRAKDLLASKAVGGIKVGPKKRVGQEGTSRKKRKAIADDELDSGHVQSFAYDGGGIHPADDGHGKEEQNKDQVVHDVAMREGRGQNDDQGVFPRPSVPQSEGEKTVSTGEISLDFGELPLLLYGDLLISDLHVFPTQANILLRFKDLRCRVTRFQESCELTQRRFGVGKQPIKVKVAELEAGKKSSDELVISQVEHIKSLEVALKESEAGVEQLRSDREKFAVAAGQGEAIRKRLVTEYFPTFVQRLLQSNEYKELVGEVLSLAVGKGFIDGISLGRTKANVDALHKATLVSTQLSDLLMMNI
ncbi:hypothetical protein Tco_1004007 [Tanacetum coccineum]|uniref:Transposase (Putative), gypsy type n=1 Tax=Tanacetum coccineum TaxID=301880 RepID=A0ABQ5FBM7_9ASTR